MQAAHLCAQLCGSLVHHSCVEEVDVRKHSSDKAHTTKLRVRSIIARTQCFGKLLRQTTWLLMLRLFLHMLLAWDLSQWQSWCAVIQVVMTRLGYTQTSVATVSEHVMQKATRACLLACDCLHSAQPKAVCHCDIRFANVLWDPQPFLADLEFAHFSPWKVNLTTHHGTLLGSPV